MDFTVVIMQGIQAALTAAPAVAELAIKAKEWINALFTGGVITKEQQGAMHAHVDKICAALIANAPPPAWTVEPDPE